MIKTVKSIFPIITFFPWAILHYNCQNINSRNTDDISSPEEYSIVSSQSQENSQTEIKSIVNPDESLIWWRGTKLMGTGKHEGTLKFKEGYLLLNRNSIIGGKFVADMRSIYITDIPLHDPIPRTNLTEHLNSDFETMLFPVAEFEISEVNYFAENKVQITGNLKIRNITQPITFIAFSGQSKSDYRANVTFDRFDWNIGENGSWLEKKLVDAQISIEVLIKLSVSGDNNP